MTLTYILLYLTVDLDIYPVIFTSWPWHISCYINSQGHTISTLIHNNRISQHLAQVPLPVQMAHVSVANPPNSRVRGLLRLSTLNTCHQFICRHSMLSCRYITWLGVTARMTSSLLNNLPGTQSNFSVTSSWSESSNAITFSENSVII